MRRLSSISLMRRIGWAQFFIIDAIFLRLRIRTGLMFDSIFVSMRRSEASLTFVRGFTEFD